MSRCLKVNIGRDARGGRRPKMADDVNQRVEDALEKLVSITEKRGNLRKDLKQDILLSVSVLRKEFSNLKCQIKTEKYEQKKLREEVKNAKDELV